MTDRVAPPARPVRLPALIFTWSASFVFAWATIGLFNDHFGRISPGRQILRYGELPFRDYFDPGYYLTEFSSAAVQWLFGDNLLGEVLMNVTFIATGSVLVLLLVRRLTGSTVAGAAAAAVGLLAMPRGYDYDKVLFYPLGLWLAWRCAEQPRLPRLTSLAAAIVVAGLYRYDSAVYLAIAGTVALLAAHHPPAARFRAVGQLAGLGLLLSAAPLLVIQLHGGLGDAIDQMVTYGVREAEPLRVFVIDPLPPADDVDVRWSAVAAETDRAARAARYGLADERPHGDRRDRTWTYRVTDLTQLRGLVSDPQVEDTNRIDRQHFTLIAEPFALRVKRALPVLRLRLRPDLADSRSALGLLLGLWVLPMLALASIAGSRREPSCGVLRPHLLSLIVLNVLLVLFILRPPVVARVGGMAGPAVTLIAWLVAWAWQRGIIPRVLAASLCIAALYALSVVSEWPRMRHLAADRISDVRGTLRAWSEPGSPRTAGGVVANIAAYLRTCTAPSDRVYATWFAPDLYFFAQRPFAGRIVATFSGHWSDERFERRSVAALAQQRPPVVLVELVSYPAFQTNYADIDAYLRANYRHVTDTSFDQDQPEPRYGVLTRRDRPTASVDPATGLPCFTGAGVIH